ncbi:5-oxoprolinase subunit C family protein [Mangrovicoccus algicola]|uniref:Urea amidolyase n=1 Tax=Mangrovicoccus algicola TaxID=2771008 RepID=A0A8J6YZ26_9RHOB|nr:urea amidolyase [Mangrovicoccus algicola]MBE3640447.1 urea amidolyase [Mangrovicoccus algicola]
MSALEILRADGVMSVQDGGRPGKLALGLSRGGAMDLLALCEAAALLGREDVPAGIEMAGAGGRFAVTAPMRIALTGAPMAATLDGARLRWDAAHPVAAGQVLQLGAMAEGLYSYLVPAGGIATDPWLGSRAAHLAIGIGARLSAGEALRCGADPDPAAPARAIRVAPRFAGGTARVIDGPQTGLFDAEVLDAFFAATFIRAPRGNRQGVALDAPRRFASDHAAGLASDVIQPGDLQMTGDGLPYVLMAECQTMGGYPRIGTVIPEDLPMVAQAAPGARLRFRRIGTEEADRAWSTPADWRRRAAATLGPLLRDPADIPDLLSYTLISGVTAGDELDD